MYITRAQTTAKVNLFRPLFTNTISGFDLVRLTNPEADRSYTVEVRYDQKWRTLCGHNWYPANARVVCKQVGQPS